MPRFHFVQGVHRLLVVLWVLWVVGLTSLVSWEWWIQPPLPKLENGWSMWEVRSNQGRLTRALPCAPCENPAELLDNLLALGACAPVPAAGIEPDELLKRRMLGWCQPAQWRAPWRYLLSGWAWALLVGIPAGVYTATVSLAVAARWIW